jgi:hypothetical protein
VAMKLVLCNDFIDRYAKLKIPSTNMFVLVKRNEVNSKKTDKFQLCDFDLPRSCSKFNVTIELEDPSTELTCCDDVEINTGECMMSIGNLEKLSIDNDSEKKWYQSNIVVKGFKDKLVNGKSVLEI